MAQPDYTPQAMEAIAFVRAAYAVPEVKNVVDLLIFLSGASGAFWFISKVLGHAALWLHDSLDHSLAVLFAVSYNIALAVLYAAVIGTLVAFSAKAGGVYVWYKVAGFIFVYFTLHVVYADRSGKLDEYGLLGYVGGVASYILFILKPKYLVTPIFTNLYDVCYFIMNSWIGKGLTLLGVLRVLFGLLRKVAQGIIVFFQWLGGKFSRKAVASLAVFLL